MMTVQMFAEIIAEQGYGEDVLTKFRAKFPDQEKVIAFRGALGALDEILLEDRRPITPSFGRTNSPPCGDGNFSFT